MSKLFNWPVFAELPLRSDAEDRFAYIFKKVKAGIPLTNDEYWDLDYMKQGAENLLETAEELDRECTVEKGGKE